MAHLDEAAERLQQALTRLETAIGEQRLNGGQDPAGEGGADIAAALAAAKRENADLQRIAGEVSDRLDQTVGRLKGLLAD